jgi:hypothetical protein
MSKSLKEAYNELPALVKLVLILALLLVLFLVIRSVWAYAERIRQEKILQNSTVNTTINGVPVSVNLGTKAVAIYGAFHKNDWFDLSEDEEKAMTELLNVPKNVIPELSAIYFQLYDKNLKSEFESYLGTDDWNKISYLFS